MFKRKSFTLLEIMIVIAILGVLASLIIGNFITSLKKGRDARRKADLEQIQKALEMFYEDNQAYPTKAPGSGFVFGGEFDGPNSKVYMKLVPNDPLSGKNYEYDYDATNHGYQLYACLEDNQQILPFNSVLSPSGGLSCTTKCFAHDGTTSITCYYGISSPNISP